MIVSDKEMIKGYVDILILLIINKKNNYGYQIAKEIQEKSIGVYSISDGTLYTSLKRLEKKGLIESYWIKNDNNEFIRKFYKITHLGQHELSLKIESWNIINYLMNSFLEEYNE